MARARSFRLDFGAPVVAVTERDRACATTLMREISGLMLRMFSFVALVGLGACSGACKDDPCARDREHVVLADTANTLGYQSRVPVRGRLVEEELPFDVKRSVPLDEVSQDELEKIRLTLRVLDRSGTSVTSHETLIDEEGWFTPELALPEATAPGRYRLEVLCGEETVGGAGIHVVSASTPDFVVRSDIDLTYLDTRFHTPAELATLMTQQASDKVTLPAMELVYRSLRRGAGSTQDRPLTFLSGSPIWFKRVLEEKARLDGVEQDGIVLKPLADQVGATLLGLDYSHVVESVKNQIGYKLSELLRLRMMVPLEVTEVLLGDDSEADVVAYVLYHRYLAGELTLAALDAELERLEVPEELQRQVAERGPPARAHVGDVSTVRAIYINATDFPNDRYIVADWMVPGLVRHHRGAWPLIQDLRAQGWVDEAAETEVRARLGL